MSFQTGENKRDGMYDTSCWEIDQSGFDKQEEKPNKKKKKKKREELKSIDQPTAEMVPLVHDEKTDMRMEDEGHKIDDRAGNFFGKKQPAATSPKSSAGSSGATYNPLSKKQENLEVSQAPKRAVSFSPAYMKAIIILMTHSLYM